MRAAALHWTQDGWAGIPDDTTGYQVVFAFLDPGLARHSTALATLRAAFEPTPVVACTTGGEIARGTAGTGSGSAAALGFDGVQVKIARTLVSACGDSESAGQALGETLRDSALSGVFVLADGAIVNGSALVRGLRAGLGESVCISGGLAGDADRFGETLVACDGDFLAGQVAAVGFCGEGMRMRTGSYGGWTVFGPRRKITGSSGNVLSTLDGKPALDLYKRYLGEDAAGLPGTALLYPIQISPPDGVGQTVVRTILSVDEATGEMTFAGDMPVGWSAQLMVGVIDGLIEGARSAGEAAGGAANDQSGGFALLVSCIGRRLLLGQRASDEIAAVVNALGGMAHAGFYSYGEISPNGSNDSCSLHNQTMTVTVFEAA